ncbi:large conductance mechanosensitive channel [Agrilactobacillus composti DSM 18527 = JCM 14202]|uniref:Large-conductance mechanosensitive channel n=1 Tax=Agrilactobacillus composti DSM 18527 = JCM 14202 TaxID=1423734 RepID=X0PDT5_9LACO|nr:large-conductance mechanosensitive channel protein MscL [Agrilactobacillus composti]KRM31550.1 large conductance mechanosensitive channel [Agrilactobacillus composti DSM 18527 = JCM 14202]GAF39429.1 large-conductance mechanosensitive channel [Agrilactobacillus composti DSM 18527 = JCM 14202]
MLKEFKAFILRGNVVDLAVAVIIGAAFNQIVSSLTKNLINPLLGLFVGKINFSYLVFSIGPAKFKVGNFINDIINFLIIAFVIFLLVKGLNKLNSLAAKPETEAEAKPEPTPEESYLKEIRDLLKAQQKQD